MPRHSFRPHLEALDGRCLPSMYSIRQLPLRPLDINAHGQVVGGILDSSVWTTRAGLWQNDTLTELGSLAGPGGQSNAYAINDAGQVVGTTQVPGGSAAFLLTPEDGDRDGRPDRWFRDDDGDGVNDLMVRLGGIAEWGNIARDINAAGHVVGNSGSRAVLWRDGSMIDLSGGFDSTGYGINDSGQVVGTYGYGFLLNPEDTDADGTPDRWYRDTDGNGLNDLTIPLGTQVAVATAITADGRVVGYSQSQDAYLWTPGVPNGSVGSLTGLGRFMPEGVNAAGVVVGTWAVGGCCEDPGYSSAMLWNGRAYYPGDLIPADSGWSALTSADAINDSGWIVGSGTVGDYMYDYHGYLLVPTGETTPPELRIGDVTLTEGNAGTRAATFTVTLSAASADPVTVDFATADGTADAGSDYVARTGTLTFAPGETSKTITVLVNGDRRGEPIESFVVNLSGPTNATIFDGQGIGTVVDDEPRIRINDVTKAEGQKGRTTLFVFTVTLSAAYDQPVTMSYRTANGTARTSDNDYVGKTGTLTFTPGEVTKTITIEVKGDSKRESDEYFYLDLFDNGINSMFGKNRGVGTILNDDGSRG